MGEDESRTALVRKLENFFGKKVILIVYNPEFEGGVVPGDERFIGWVIDKERKNEPINNCILILSGSGGDFKTALHSSYILRNWLSYYACFVPSVAGSALCYLILHSNKLLMGKNSLLTQIDPLFEHKGLFYRAIKNLDNENEEIKNKSHDIFNHVTGQLQKLLSHKNSLVGFRDFKPGDMSPIIYLFMGKEDHESGVRYAELSKLNLNIDLVQDEIVNDANYLIALCRRELSEENSRLVIHTKEGGYFLKLFSR